MKLIFTTMVLALLLVSCMSIPPIPASDIPSNGILLVGVEGPQTFWVNRVQYSARKLALALGKLSKDSALKQIRFLINPALVAKGREFDCKNVMGVMA
jgi:hypothetical protein